MAGYTVRDTETGDLRKPRHPGWDGAIRCADLVVAYTGHAAEILAGDVVMATVTSQSVAERLADGG